MRNFTRMQTLGKRVLHQLTASYSPCTRYAIRRKLMIMIIAWSLVFHLYSACCSSWFFFFQGMSVIFQVALGLLKVKQLIVKLSCTVLNYLKFRCKFNLRSSNIVGGRVASWLMHSTLERAVQVRALAGHIVFLGKTPYSHSASLHPGV